MPSLMLSLDYVSNAIDEGAPSPTVSLQVLGSGRDLCDLPLESLRIREEGRPRALAHLVGKDLLVARDDARDNRPRGVRRRRLLERQHLGHLGVNRARIHAKHLRVLPPQHRARDLSERVRRGLRGAVRRENREADERGHRVEVGDGAAAILPEYWREGLRDREGAEEVHFHLLSPALDPLRISEFATEEADDARVVDQEVHVRRSRGGGGDLRGVRDIELQRRDAGAVAGHERVEGRDAAGGGGHLSYARPDERVHDRFADAPVWARGQGGLA